VTTPGLHGHIERCISDGKLNAKTGARESAAPQKRFRTDYRGLKWAWQKAWYIASKNGHVKRTAPISTKEKNQRAKEKRKA